MIDIFVLRKSDMFPDSLALTNYPKQLQQTFDIKFRPPQAITIETLHAPPISSHPHNSVSQHNRSQLPLKTEFDRKMFAMKLLAQKKMRELSRQENQTPVVGHMHENNLIGRVTSGETEKIETSLKAQGQPEAKIDKKNIPEIVRLKKILENQLVQLESIIDTTKGRKQQNITKKSTQSRQIDDKELSTKINKIITSLLKEISTLERQILHFMNNNGHSDIGQKLLSTYQFSMSFIQTYHNEYSAKLSEKSQDIFKEKLSKLTKSLTHCASQLSEFPNMDFPMPDLAPKLHKPIIRNPNMIHKKNKSSNPKKVPILPKRLPKNPKTTKAFEYALPDQNRCFIRKSNPKHNSENIFTDFSEEESLTSLLARKPGHSRLSSPSNSRAPPDAIPALFLSKRPPQSSAKPVQTTNYDVINDLSQETVEELIDEQISDVLTSIDLSQIISDSLAIPHFKPLPVIMEDLDYYLSAIDSYENLLSSIEKNLNSAEEPVKVREIENPTPTPKLYTEQESMIIIPKPTQSTESQYDEVVNTEFVVSKNDPTPKQPINPVLLENLTDDRYKMLRYNRLHQPSIRLALKHNLLERLKDEILNSSMDNVSEQIFRTLDNYVEKNFFDEFLKTPETMDLVRNILRQTEDNPPEVPITTSTLGIQTDQRTKNAQIQSILASPTPTNSPLSSRVYSSDFSSYSVDTDKETVAISDNSVQSLSASQQSIQIPSHTHSTTERSHPLLHKCSEEVVYAVSFTEQFSEMTVEMPTLSLESPLPVNHHSSSSSPDSHTPIGSSIYLSQAVAELKTFSEVQLSFSKSESIELSLTHNSESPLATPTTLMVEESTSLNSAQQDEHFTSSQLSLSSLLTSEDQSLSELAYTSVLKKRSDIVCLDIESMLPLQDTTEIHTLDSNSESEKQTSEHLHEYTDTFTQSNSTLYSLSQTLVGKEGVVPPPPLTPIFQDSLDSSRALTHSASSRSVVTESIEEEISDF